MGMLGGLESYGLSGLDRIDDIYAEEAENPREAAAAGEAAKAERTKDEIDYLVNREYECEICQKKIKQRVLRGAKLKMVGQDLDLRPIYEGVDAQKYDVILCPHCGYAVLVRLYGPMAPTHRKLIREKISAGFRPQKAEVPLRISYEEAYPRYKLALVNAVVRQAKSSERALICLKTAWLLRGWQQSGEVIDPAQLAELAGEEQACLANALEGFLKARATESAPYVNMNATTLDYLTSALCIETKTHASDAARMLQEIVTSRTASSQQKDKARDMLEMLKGLHADA